MRDTTHFEPWTGRGAKAWATLRAEDRVRAPYAILTVLLGPPARDAPEKCSTIWFLQEQDQPRALYVVRDVQDEDDPTFSRVAFRSLPSYDWLVEAPDEASLSRLCRWLSAKVIAEVQKVRQLTPEARARLNELMAAGTPMADAMQQVAAWNRPEDASHRFAWPIRDLR